MRRKSSLFIILAAFLVLAGVVANFGRVFAANSYNINYSGGAALSSSNVTIDPSLSTLTAIYSSKWDRSFTSSNKWEKAYYQTKTSCVETRLIRVWNNSRVSSSDNLVFTLAGSNYDMKVKINKIVLENLSATQSTPYAVLVSANGGITVSEATKIFPTASCSGDPYDSSIKRLTISDEGRIFVEFNAKIVRHGTNEPFISEGMYFGITDIDAAQSYQVRHKIPGTSDSLLSKGNMFALSAAALDTSSVDPTLKNRLVQQTGSTGYNYIYSQYSDHTLSIDFDNRIYVGYDTTLQTNGLDMVFGFANGAGSSVRFYANQGNIKYQTDGNGTISGTTDETIIHGENPSGSTSTPSGNYVFLHWVADKDVTLEDGTTITAGQPLTPEQVKNVVVSGDITFTAIHEARYTVNYVTDGYGTIKTGELETETLEPNGNPTGSESTPNEHYVFIRWTVDKNVTLEDGTIITAQNSITPEQIKQVVVNQDITFTAEHDLEQLPVTYETDGHGTITGVISHYVAYGSTPWGSTSAPDEHYTFKHWIADKDVVLEDGTPITAGQPLTPAQVQQVIVTEELTFTAVHEAIMFHINYASDEHGIISGLGSEDKIEGSNPSGSASTANEHYEFKHWTADKDVTLTDGTEIKAGDPITPEQVQQIVVAEDLTLTAIHEQIIRHVNYESDNHGTISGKENESVVDGSNPTGSASTPNEHYAFSHWTVNKDVTLTDSTAITAGQPLTSVQVQQVVITEDLTFTAIHEAINHHVSYVSDDHGTISGITGEDVFESSNPSGSSSNPNEHYEFKHWVADKDVTLTDNTVITAGQPLTPAQVEQVVIAEDITFTAVHEQIRHHIAYQSDDHGTITGITGEDAVEGGNPAGSTSTPNEHYEFKHWVADKDVTLTDGTEIKAGGPITPEQVEQIVVEQDLTLTAVHQIVQYRVTYDSDSNGEITGIDNESIEYGESPSGSASTPNDHYELDHWTVNKDVTLTDDTIITAGEPLTPEQVGQIIVTEDLTVTAIHKLVQHRISYTSDSNGEITGIDSESIEYGSSPSGSSSTPNLHYEFKHWVADKDVTLTDGTEIKAGGPITPAQVQQIVVAEDLTLTAIHEEIRFHINYESDDHGTITGATSEDIVEGSNPNGSTSTPDDTYVFEHWVADKDVTLTDDTVITAGEPLTPAQVQQIVVAEDLTLTAIYEEIVYHVDYMPDDHGIITGKKYEDIVINHNPTGSTSTPDEQYEFKHWVANKNITLEDGTEIAAGQPITPAQVEQVVVDKDILFTAIHKKKQYSVTYSSDSNGEITGIDNESIEYGETPSGSASTPNDHYEFKHWIADKDVTLTDGTEIKAGDPITPEQVGQIVVAEDLTLTAIHEQIRHHITYESDDHGAITGITDENASEGDNPSGSASTPNDHYEFKHWIADKDVTLTDGTEIKAGDPITPEQVEQIVVEQDLTLTAVNEEIHYRINYEPGKEGEISGITSEDVAIEQNPTGSGVSPEEGFEFDYWTADVDVVLVDGTEIKAGEPISPDQVKQIVVEQDIVLTAIYRAAPAPAPEVPNTGSTTNNGAHALSNNTIFAIIAGILVTASSFFFLKKALRR